MYGASTGNPISVTPGGNVSTVVIYNNIVNVGRVVLRKNSVYQLPDCKAAWVKIHASPNNGANVWLGGVIDQIPQDNVGYPIIPGATLEMPCTNSNQFSLIPTQDGDTVYILVGAVDTSANITPGSPDALDITPPTILSQSPGTGLLSQPINTPISLLADRALGPASVNNSTVSISPVPPGITINVVQDSGNPANILILYSGGNLGANTQYTIGVSGITNINGFMISPPYTGTFTTGNTTTPPDMTPPTITSTNPTSGATKVPLSTNPTITFSKPILPSSINTTSIKVTDVAATTFLTGYTFSQSGDLKTITINGLTFSNSKQYRIDVFNTATAGHGIEDSVGVFLDNTYSITFTTVAPAVVIYNVSGNSYSSMNATNAYLEVGEHVNTSSSILNNRIPVGYTFILQKVGNPSGSFSVLWRNGDSSGNLFDYRTLATITANTLGTTDTTITVNDPSNTVKLKTFDIISIRYNNGTTSDYIKVKCASPEVIDGSNTCLMRVLYDHSSSVTTTVDNAGTISVAP
jgi:Big-like domain-containing protein